MAALSGSNGTRLHTEHLAGRADISGFLTAQRQTLRDFDGYRKREAETKFCACGAMALRKRWSDRLGRFEGFCRRHA